ncbi:hypothetical protein O3P69_016747 [Scylla paramamosain]|uniref:Uncharacterized protein n=1 Tax=Scylla paramamosain TaxID=85552 RepID=A0AAW0SY39_SCYPA
MERRVVIFSSHTKPRRSLRRFLPRGTEGVNEVPSRQAAHVATPLTGRPPLPGTSRSHLPPLPPGDTASVCVLTTVAAARGSAQRHSIRAAVTCRRDTVTATLPSCPLLHLLPQVFGVYE